MVKKSAKKIKLELLHFQVVVVYNTILKEDNIRSYLCWLFN